MQWPFCFTYIINFSDFNLVSFMSYTLQKKPPCTGLVCVGPHDSPCDSTTAPQPHSLHLNLISINYDNLWLNTLNMVVIWIVKKSLNNYICHLSWLRKLSPTHTHPLIFIHEFSEPYKLLFFELESLIKCCHL